MPMRRSLYLIAALLPLAALPARGDDPLPDVPPQQPAMHLKLEEACSLRLADGQLTLASQLRGMRLVDCPADLAGLPGRTTLTLRPNYFSIYNAQSDGSITIESVRDTISIRVRTPNLTIDYRQSSESPSGFGYREARLHVSDGDWNSKASITAGDFAALRSEHPAEVFQYLGPVFRQLKVAGFFPDERIARQALAARGGDETPKELRELVRQLDANSFKVRERAMRQMSALGPDAVALLENWDRASLTPQQQTQIDAFLHAHLSSKEVERKRKDISYVLDCLYCEDPEARALALRVIRKELKLQLTFDPQADPFAQAPAIEALRAKVTPPTTQPSVEP